MRRIAVLTVKLLAVAIATFAVFRAGAVWSSRALLQAQHYGSPNAALDPLLAHFTRYAIGVLWPLPGAAMLFLAAGGFDRGKRWWWLLLLVALGWLAATWIVQGPQVYYYWLTPQQ